MQVQVPPCSPQVTRTAGPKSDMAMACESHRHDMPLTRKEEQAGYPNRPIEDVTPFTDVIQI